MSKIYHYKYSIRNKLNLVDFIESKKAIVPDLTKLAVTTIGNHSFRDSDITDLKIPEGIQEIGSYAFYNSEITNIELPSTLQAISTNAFAGCKNLNTINIPEGISVIERDCFSGADLINVRLPSTLTSIRAWAFNNNKNLTKLVYDGTMEQWANIELVKYWNYNAPIETVVCSDGTITL